MLKIYLFFLSSPCPDYRECQTDDHKCGGDNGICIPKDKMCDGYFDCRDESDETDDKCGEKLACDPQEFLCENREKCIAKYQVRRVGRKRQKFL